MSRCWSVFAPVAFLATLLVLMLPGGARPSPVSAEDCTQDNTGTLVIEIIDSSTGQELTVDGTRVLVKPDPRDFELDNIVVDTALDDANTSQDRDSTPGSIRIEDACSTEGSESYTATLFELPDSLEECEVGESADSTELDAEESATLTLVIDCTGVGPTPTATVAPTPGAAATVVANASPLSLSCSGTSIVTITVRDAAGNAVGPGTAVAITTTLGSITQPSQVTGDAGTVATFFAAPADQGGTATITAKAGNATGTATVSVSCAGAGGTTTAPPPTVATGGVGAGVITPPNTGNAGLSGHDGSPPAWTGAAIGAGLLLGLATLRVRTR